MIDFNKLYDKLDNIKRPIGGEYYIEFKSNKDFNVYNEFDATSNTLITSKKNLIIYQTDKTFDNSQLYLLNNYEKIFAVNNIVKDNNRIISLPLGIVDNGKSINFATCYKYRDFSLYEVIKECRHEYIGYPNKLIYMNYRLQPKQTDRENSLRLKDGVDETQITDEISRVSNWLLFDTRENIKRYYMKCMDYIFIACPEGYGIDTYRFYEMLYLGRIPVVLHNAVTDMFNDLPILFLDKWNDFGKEYQKFIENFDISNYNFDKLTTEYWDNIII